MRGLTCRKLDVIFITRNTTCIWNSATLEGLHGDRKSYENLSRWFSTVFILGSLHAMKSRQRFSRFLSPKVCLHCNKCFESKLFSSQIICQNTGQRIPSSKCTFIKVRNFGPKFAGLLKINSPLPSYLPYFRSPDCSAANHVA